MKPSKSRIKSLIGCTHVNGLCRTPKKLLRWPPNGDAVVLLCPRARFWRPALTSKHLPRQTPISLRRPMHIWLQFGIDAASNLKRATRPQLSLQVRGGPLTRMRRICDEDFEQTVKLIVSDDSQWAHLLSPFLMDGLKKCFWSVVTDQN